jgi:hypothetical protein
MDVLVDFDLDFCFDTPEDITLASNKRLYREADRVIAWAASLDAERRALMIDHHEALAHWDAIGFRDAMVVHVDAHHDMFGEDHRVWRRALGARAAQIGIGDYLLQAVREDIVHSVDWVVPPWTSAATEMPKLRQQVGSWYASRVRVRPFSDDLPKSSRLLTVSVSPEWVPPESRGWAEDVLLQLGFPPELVKKVLQECDTRWKLCLAHPEAMRAYRYTFKYAYAPRST